MPLSHNLNFNFTFTPHLELHFIALPTSFRNCAPETIEHAVRCSTSLAMRADCLPHANVVVRVNGEVLTEYQTEDEALTAATFIEATPGAHFSVGLNLDAGFAYRDPKDRILFKVHVDGLYVRSHILTTHLKPVVDDTIAGAVDTKDGVSTLKRCCLQSTHPVCHLANKWYFPANICYSGRPS